MVKNADARGTEAVKLSVKLLSGLTLIAFVAVAVVGLSHSASAAVDAKVYVTNRDVGFLEPGMPAQIRVDAFPYTQFGSIEGELKSIGTLPLPPDQTSPQARFPAYLALDQQYLNRNGNQFKVSPGQSVQANLVLRDKRVITLLTDAIQKAFDSLRSIRSSK